jgi:hypothetical protein
LAVEHLERGTDCSFSLPTGSHGRRCRTRLSDELRAHATCAPRRNPRSDWQEKGSVGATARLVDCGRHRDRSLPTKAGHSRTDSFVSAGILKPFHQALGQVTGSSTPKMMSLTLATSPRSSGEVCPLYPAPCSMCPLYVTRAEGSCSTWIIHACSTRNSRRRSCVFDRRSESHHNRLRAAARPHAQASRCRISERLASGKEQSASQGR